MNIVTCEQLKNDAEIQALLTESDRQLQRLGYTEHGQRHRDIVCRRVEEILRSSGASEREILLGIIAGYLHDVGCIFGRHNHAQNGALLVYRLLTGRKMDFDDVASVVNAVACHDNGVASSKISASLILADKSDVCRSRVRDDKVEKGRLISVDDIHDRVNFAVISNRLKTDCVAQTITFDFTLDDSVSSAMDYFEIFLNRMKMCQSSANFLGFKFRLVINGQTLA